MLQFIFTLLGLSFVLAALPPLQPAQREAWATHIIEGTIISTATPQKIARRGRTDIDRESWDNQYEATLAVRKFLKSESFTETEAQEVTLVYWKPGMRPRGWTGPQGQNSLLNVGDDVTVYIKRKDSGRPRTYHLMEPNGIERNERTRPEDSEGMAEGADF